ncbi:MAG: cell division protein ZapE, partial [Pseudomonadota bacterium]|nr:cell division protein ZapE [Pseudomonadota bacterium]
MPHTPAQRYQADLDSGAIVPDEAQRIAVEALQDLYMRLEDRAKVKPGLLDRLLNRSRSAPEQGLYLWGGVGRGKTYLMDSFFEALSFDKKKRMHFNRFMQRVHEDLTELSGLKNPLDTVADRIASETIVLCFDEFYVSDIGDAMLLGGLMQALFDRGITLVATSNIPPDGLYKDGLQRSRFIPAIRAVESFSQVMNVDSGIDYRLRVLTQSELYFVPDDASSESPLPGLFADLTGGK